MDGRTESAVAAADVAAAAAAGVAVAVVAVSGVAWAKCCTLSGRWRLAGRSCRRCPGNSDLMKPSS